MNKYVIAVFPNQNSAGTKMSRDIELVAENDHFAKEQAQNMYPDAKIMIRRSVRIATPSSFADVTPDYEAIKARSGSAVAFGVLTGNLFEAMGCNRFISALSLICGFITMIAYQSILIGGGVFVFGLLVAYYVNSRRRSE